MSVKGVPALLNKVGGITSTATLLGADAVKVLGLFPAPLWGIYDSDLQKPIIEPDSIIAFDLKREWRLPDYPQEQGSFQRYNKVATPYDARITMTKGGTDDDRMKFLQKMEEVAKSLDTYAILTPGKTFMNANIQHYDYRRTAIKGLTLLTIDVWLTEIRLDTVKTTPTTKDVSGADAKSAGIMSPAAATQAQKSLASKVQ